MLFLINTAILIFAFGIQKKFKNPYFVAVLCGLIKAASYLLLGSPVVVTAVVGVIFAALTAAFIFFLRRLDRPTAEARPAESSYRSLGAQKIAFRWEYFPLIAIFLLILGGEMLLIVLRTVSLTHA